MTEEIIAAEHVANEMVAAANYQKPVIASFDTSTKEGQKKAYNASNGADHKLADVVGETITIADYYVEPIELVNEQTGEMTYQPHVVIFGANGETYECVSKGVQTCIDRLNALGIIGNGSTADFTIKERRARLGKMLYLEMV